MAIISVDVPTKYGDDLKAAFRHPEWTNAELGTYIKQRWVADLKLVLKAYKEQQAIIVAVAAVVDPGTDIA